ncbi:MAG: surface antigen, partial [Modestobacter sp.]|nr:surface antigen [Modestobacter sp.]
MDHRTTSSVRAVDHRARRRPAVRRPGLYLGAAVAGAMLVGVVLGTDPAAEAAAEPVSVAQELGLTAGSGAVDVTEHLRPLEELAASRSTREAAETAAQQAQAAADKVELDRRAAEAAAAEAAARAAA